MVLIAFEGQSKTGKSTLVENVKKRLEKKNEKVIVMKGPGQINIPGAEQWKLYNHYMHAVLHRMQELNPNLIILGDRIFSEAVVGKRDTELLRRYLCYDALVINLSAEEEELKKRGTKETGCGSYGMLTSRFDSITIDTSLASIKQATDKIIDFLIEKKVIE